MKFTLFSADCTGVASNCSYPERITVCDEETFGEAVRRDHVCAEYRNDYRSVENFLCSDCLVMDIDNDGSDDPSKWVTDADIDEIFGDVDYVLAASRHHLVSKDGKSPRPKYHIYLPIEECTDAERYAAMKQALARKYDFFDDNALDAARFLFGADPQDVVWHEGWLQITDIIGEASEEGSEEEESTPSVIEEGSRNNSMSRFAGRVLKRYGITEKAHDAFLEHAKRCTPPLDDSELNTIWASAVRFFNKKVKTSEGYVSPEEYNADFDTASLKPEDYSDIGEAKVLAREYGNELKYTKATDYLRHDGTRWVEDRELALGAAEEFLDLQLEDAKDEVQRTTEALVSLGVDEDVVKTGGTGLKKAVESSQLGAYFDYLGAQAYLKFVMKYRNYKNIVATQNAAKPMLALDVNELDKDPLLINTPAGTVDMRKGSEGLRMHDPSDLITKITTMSPGNEGKRIWEDALDTFFCGDRELIDYVQMTVGLAAIGKVYEEHLIIAYGGGANGKSTFWNTIFRVLGNYAGKISAEALTMGCKRNVKPEMAELKGKRLIIASEMEEGMRLNTATVKQLCSTDEIQAEKKYKDPFDFVPSHTLVLYTNYLPKVGANDDGIWRRLIVIPFNARITGKSDVKNYADHLYEKAGSYIMTWIIEGARKAIEADFKTKEPKVVKEAVESYRGDNDWLGQFIEGCCETDPSYTEKSGELYQAYRAFCMSTGEYVRSTSDFYASLDKAGYMRRKTNRATLVCGLRLMAEQDFLE